MKNRGVTFVEILVVLSCVTSLLTVSLPALLEVRDAARLTQCKNNLKLIGQALHSYNDAYGSFPSGVEYSVRDGQVSTWSWVLKTLPFNSEAPRYNSIYVDAGDLQQALDRKLMRHVPGYRCPSDDVFVQTKDVKSNVLHGQWGFTNYLGVAGTDSAQSLLSQEFGALNPKSCFNAAIAGGRKRTFQSGILFGDSAVKLDDIIAGSSNSLMVCERAIPRSGQFGWWSGTGNAGTCPVGWGDVVLTSEVEIWNGQSSKSGDDELEQVSRWWSRHAGGISSLFADGSVKFLSVNLNRQLLQRLSNRESEVIGEF